MEVKKFNKKPKVLFFQGSPRDKDTCPNMDSKTHLVVEYLLDKYKSKLDIEVIDLSVNQNKKPIIQPCKGCVSTAGGYQCHWKCVASDQRVHTIDGFKEIKDIEVGDILQDGNIVTKHIKTSESSEIFELKLKDGRKIELTSDHKVKTLSKERFRDKQSNFKFYRKEHWVELKDLCLNDNIPYIETDNIFSDNKSEDDILYLIYGLIWGDGTFCKNTPILYVDSKESEYLSEIEKKLHNYITSIKKHITVNSISEFITNDSMVKINFGTKIGKSMLDLFKKTSAKERRLNIDSFKTKSQILNFLNGWISTDGSISEDGINIYNVSYNCLRDLQLLLSRIGISSNICDMSHKEIITRDKKHIRTSSLSISNQSSIDKLKSIDLIHIGKRKKLSDIIKKKPIKFNYSKVKSIKSIGYKTVYDIEVSSSHEFNCEGIKIHNCSCYFKGSKKKTDLLSELDVYSKLENSDAFIVFSPIHWNSVTSQVKTLFDRLVCANLSLDKDKAIEIFGKGNIKNSDITGPAKTYGKYDQFLKNHLEGKVAGFYIHGDNGADDYKNKEFPKTLDVKDNEFNPKDAIMPIVFQCRYSAINAPDLIEAFYINERIDYYSTNININDDFFKRADRLIEALLIHISNNSH